jgi:hypothetical protein
MEMSFLAPLHIHSYLPHSTSPCSLGDSDTPEPARTIAISPVASKKHFLYYSVLEDLLSYDDGTQRFSTIKPKPTTGHIPEPVPSTSLSYNPTP